MIHNMLLMKLIVCFIIITIVNSRNLNNDSNVTEREANDDLFPDWVPFKNKHGDELGEFVQVEKKAKPKKRLALPVNFMLKAVEESNDYFDGGQGESDNDDYFEKKEWSDTNRMPVEKLNHTQLSDIDGLVNIITKPPPSIIPLEQLEDVVDKEIISSEDTHNETLNARETLDETKDDREEKMQEELLNTDQKANLRTKTSNKYIPQPSEDYDYDDEVVHKKTEEKKPELSEKERKENEERKARILGEVDKLKQRHEQEQRFLTESLREEEMTQEELERDKIDTFDRKDKYGRISKKHYAIPEYDDYEDSSSVEDKYKLNYPKVLASQITTVSPEPAKNVKTFTEHRYIPQTLSNNTETDSNKLSVFKNPQLYMIDNDDIIEETTTVTTTKRRPTKTATTKSFLSPNVIPSVSTAEPESNVRISLVPQKGNYGEPTLFFPKKRKNKRKRKTTTAAPDSSVAETSDKFKDTLTAPSGSADINLTTDKDQPAISNILETPSGGEYIAESAERDVRVVETAPSAPESALSVGESAPSGVPSAPSGFASAPSKVASAPSGADSEQSGVGSVPSAVDAAPTSTGTAAVTVNKSNGKKTLNDAIPAPSINEEQGHANFQHKRGGGKDYSSEHEEEHGEHGKKAYEGFHKDSKTAKGHHDKEDHVDKYDEDGGFKKHDHDEKNHYGTHHHEEHGKKHAKYEESGKHSKGHSTKGSHDVHKKEEYEKKVEFFEEEGDSAEDEKHGGYNHENEHKKGGHFKKGNLNAGHVQHEKGEQGQFAKGGHTLVHRGHKHAAGHDSHGKRGHSSGHREAQTGGKKWIYHHGSPATNANLVIIDRRTDQYQHGPQYYG